MEVTGWRGRALDQDRLLAGLRHRLEKNSHQFKIELYKEKEMVDFRRWFLALALVGLFAATASAQTPAFQCVANAGVPPIVRAEGLAELLGDIVLNCTGGTPTAAGATVQQVNVQIFLNTNVTSRLLADPWTEALLIIDEPGSASNPTTPQLICGAAGTVEVSVTPGVCTITGTGDGIGTYNGTGARANIFQGRTNGANSIVWLGVPVDPPGTTRTRILRITNVRGNANQLGVSSTLIPTQIIAFVSATGTTSIPINNPQQTIAYVQSGMTFSRYNYVKDASTRTFDQCTSNNSDLASDATKTTGCIDFRLRYQENFASAFKTRFSGSAVVESTSNVPGAVFTQMETGFYGGAAFSAQYNGGRGNMGLAGLATQGTRLRAVFNAVPQGVRLYVTLNQLSSSNGSNTGQLVTVNADGSGAFSATPATTTTNSSCASPVAFGALAVAEVPLFPATTGGYTGSVVWEITGNDPLAIGRVDFGLMVAYAANTANNLPTPDQQSTVNGMFAPVSTVTTASAVAPVPRFADTSSALNTFIIAQCQTNLLFPFITNQGGFDTGMAISNTSKDPFGTAVQSGTCTLYYYGDVNGTAATPTDTTKSAVPAGDYAIWTLSVGGKFGLSPQVGFMGYMIARCQFQYAHGYAFISDLGAQKLAQGYVALVLDASKGSRTGKVSEVLGM